MSGLLGKIKNFLKESKVISRGLRHLAGVKSLGKYSRHLNTAATGAQALGFGRKRVGRKRGPKRRAPKRR